MAYIPEVGGYIVDVPVIDFVRCDGTAFHYDEVTTASITNNANNLPITGGQGAFPLAVIDTDKTLELAYESAKFTPEIFAMANATKTRLDDAVICEANVFEVETGLTITIPHVTNAAMTRIAGLEYADATATGKFTAVAGEGNTVITFAEGDVVVGDTVLVTYYRIVADATVLDVKTTGTTAKGSVWAHYPIYSDGADCATAAMLGALHIHIYRARVSALPGFSNNYKSASTNGLTFAALDPRRPDKKMFTFIVEKFDANGEVVPSTEAGENADWSE